MLLAFIFFVTTNIFGIHFVVRVRKSLSSLFAQLASGWLFGSSMTSIFLWTISYFLRFSKLTIFLVFIIQIILSAHFHKKTRSCFQKKKFSVEDNPWLFLSAFIILGFAYAYMKRMYSSFPSEIPSYASEIFEFESSFIQSLLHGINRKRPKFLSFLDPQLHNHSLPLSCLPLFYTSALMKLGMSYSQTSILICFMNIFASIIFLFYSTVPYTRHFLSVALCFAFNSGWAFYRFFGKSNISNDLVHDIGRWTTAPWFQTLGVFLTLSKCSSYTVSLGLLALSCASFTNPSKNRANSSIRTSNQMKRSNLLLGGLAASLIPSTITSIAFFFSVSNFSPSFLKFLPSIIPKLLNVKLNYNPIWREYQMQGYFYSQLLVFYDSFGPSFFAIFLFPLTKPSASFLQKI